MNYAQPVERRRDGSLVIPYDWYPGVLPSNMRADDMVYFDTSYSFTSFHSAQPIGLELGYASGNYGRSNFIVGRNGVLKVGKFVVLEATNLICNKSISIGDHCMFSWGSVVTDSWLTPELYPSAARKAMLKALAAAEHRDLEFEYTNPVVIEDNVWVGFDAVIMPDVHLGQGSVIGCKTIITEDVPPYAVVVGQPARIVKYLEPDDTAEAKTKAMQEYLKK
jgi:acetyltransferase-like isoleucine patch superfamily enzyme